MSINLRLDIFFDYEVKSIRYNVRVDSTKTQKYGGHWDFSNNLHVCIQIQHNTKHKINIPFM